MLIRWRIHQYLLGQSVSFIRMNSQGASPPINADRFSGAKLILKYSMYFYMWRYFQRYFGHDLRTGLALMFTFWPG